MKDPVTVKEVRFRPTMAEADFNTKKASVLRFLKADFSVKTIMMLRGREVAHPERAADLLLLLAEELKTDASVKSGPDFSYGRVEMTFVPKKKK